MFNFFAVVTYVMLDKAIGPCAITLVKHNEAYFARSNLLWCFMMSYLYFYNRTRSYKILFLDVFFF